MSVILSEFYVGKFHPEVTLIEAPDTTFASRSFVTIENKLVNDDSRTVMLVVAETLSVLKPGGLKLRLYLMLVAKDCVGTGRGRLGHTRHHEDKEQSNQKGCLSHDTLPLVVGQN